MFLFVTVCYHIGVFNLCFNVFSFLAFCAHKQIFTMRAHINACKLFLEKAESKADIMSHPNVVKCVGYYLKTGVILFYFAFTNSHGSEIRIKTVQSAHLFYQKIFVH